MSDSPNPPSDEDPSAPSSGAGRSQTRNFGYRALIAFVLIDAVVVASVGIGAFHRGREIASFRSPPASNAPKATFSPPAPTPSPSPLRPCERPILIGTVSADQVAARITPDPKAKVIEMFGRENVLGTPQVFDLAKKVSVGGRSWYKALLPIRPNGTTGYINGKELKVTYTTYRLEVERSKFHLTLFNGCERIRSFPVGIGTGATPTPVGKFYLTGLFKPPDPTTIYGVSIYTLSGFSEVLTHWRLGGIIGLHGTNDPGSIGRNSSHGCIRMRNADILTLEKILPLGTPILIR